MSDNDPAGSAAPRRAQFEVIAGISLAIVLMAAISWVLWTAIGITPRRLDYGERLAYAAKWCLIPGIFLFVGVIMIANHRFFTCSIDPLDGYVDRQLAVWQRYLQNTLEQTVLFVIAVTAFSAVAPQYWLKAIPIAATLFGVGRILFAGGYLIRSTFRATGFAMTAYPIAMLYAVTVYLYWFSPAGT